MASTDPRPRLFNPGWGLWMFLGLALAFALLKFWPGGHPMAGAAQVDVCGRARVAAAVLSPAPAAILSGGAGGAGAPQGQCELRFAATDPASPESAPALSVFVTTQAMLRRQGSRVSTAKWIEVTQAEVRASTPPVESVAGPWRTGFTAGSPSGQQVTLYAEDEGVVLVLVGRQVARATLVEFGTSLARALRKGG